MGNIQQKSNKIWREAQRYEYTILCILHIPAYIHIHCKENLFELKNVRKNKSRNSLHK